MFLVSIYLSGSRWLLALINLGVEQRLFDMLDRIREGYI